MWNTETLQAINQTDDLKIAPYRANGKLFVRAYSGTHSSWYQAAIAQQSGEIHAIDQVFKVHFAPVHDAALNEKIDAAYREKYASSRYMAHMIGNAARAATVEILPQ